MEFIVGGSRDIGHGVLYILTSALFSLKHCTKYIHRRSPMHKLYLWHVLCSLLKLVMKQNKVCTNINKYGCLTRHNVRTMPKIQQTILCIVDVISKLYVATTNTTVTFSTIFSYYPSLFSISSTSPISRHRSGCAIRSPERLCKKVMSSTPHTMS